jgi:large subunit ribosomal protein L20
MRVKRGIVSRRKHDAIRKLAKGFRSRRKSCYKIAKLAVQKSLQYSYRDRRAKKRDFRSLWIVRINAAARAHGLSYSRFIAGLQEAQVMVDRKMLADLAVTDPMAFSAFVDLARSAV